MMRSRLVLYLFAVGFVTVSIAAFDPTDSSATAEYVPGDVIVRFYNEDSTIVFPDSSVVSIYSSLNAICTDWELLSIRPLFSPGSILRNIFTFKFPPETDLDQVMSVLDSLNFIRETSKNWIGQVNADPDDYAFNNDFFNDGRLDEWTLQRTQVDRAWNITTGSDTIIVAVIDYGIDYGHIDLHDVIWQNIGDGGVTSWGEDADHDGHTLELVGSEWVVDPGDINGISDDGDAFIDDLVGYNFNSTVQPQYDPRDVLNNSHGTMMGAIISAMTDNGLGVAGITWHSRLMPLKVGHGTIETAFVLLAINYAIEKGADVVNMSFGIIPDNPGQLEMLCDEIARGDSVGVIFVASMPEGGLSGDPEDFPTETIGPPASCLKCIAVAAVDSVGYKTSYSHWHSDVGMCAPAWDTPEDHSKGIVTCSYTNNPVVNYPGSQTPHKFWFTRLLTSGAAAQVSGVAALLKAQYPDSSSDFIKSELFRGAIPLPDSLFYQGKLGHGMANAFRSLTKWGAIEANTTWSGTVYVSGDVRVENGATLTIEPGTDVFIWPDDVNYAYNPANGVDASRVEFWVNGFLQVNGTEVNPVNFVAWDESGESQSPTAWFGIIVIDSTGSGAEFNHTIVKNAFRGIQGNGDISIKDCTIENCEIGVSLVDGDSVYIEDTVIRDCELHGVNLLEGTRLRIKDSTIENTEGSGIAVYSGAKLYADSTEFRENFYGVEIYPGDTPTPPATAEFVFCDIKDNGVGLRVDEISGVTVKSCLISGNDAGVLCVDGGNIELRTNNIKNNSYGIYCYSSAPRIRRGNVIKLSDTAGIWCDLNSNAIVESTTVDANDVGVFAKSGSNPNLGRTTGVPSAGRNVITNDSTLAVQNLTSNWIRAERNYWGLPWPDSTRFYGSLDYTPFLIHKPDIGPKPYEDPGEAPVFQPNDGLPLAYGISNGYPNPFNPETRLDYQVPRPGGHVVIAVFNVKGQRVVTLADKQQAPGFYTTTWDGKSDRGAGVATGVYFVQMQAANFTKTRKLVFLK